MKQNDFFGRKAHCLLLAVLFCMMSMLLCACTDGGAGTDTETVSHGEELTDMTDMTDNNRPVWETADGIRFTAEGDFEEQEGVFALKNALTLCFAKDTCPEDFNRFALSYTSDTPLVCTLVYDEDGKDTENRFFLEAGEHTFRCLTERALSGKTASDIKQLHMTPCMGKTAEFALTGLTTDTVTLDSTGVVYYLRGDRYTVGIRLNWGGGICYIADSENPIPGMENLINQADTGRLVQQSYYGTPAREGYTPGSFNNAVWSYNPVQGGDQYQNHSRIIDIEVTDTAVYVKSQPQDWSLDNQITPSYMENTYTLCDGYIRVDNRFVDFSGWEHPYSHQELPAFYTVSYLDRFVWYGGSKPWTGDALSARDDLNFWGDPKYSADCQFYMRESNTETWCAWVSSADDYGIGLYVPNIDLLYAGRHMYNGSKDAHNGACSYVAPINRLQMVSFTPITYSYIMACGSTEQIRAIFADNRDFADNASLHENYMSQRLPDDMPEKPDDQTLDMTVIDFTKPENVWLAGSPYNTTPSYDADSGVLRLTADVGFDVQILLDYTASAPTLQAEQFSKIAIIYRIPEDNAKSVYGCELFLCTGDRYGAEAGCSVTGEYIADGEYHTLELDTAGLDFWGGAVNAIRFDWFNDCGDGDTIEIRSIALIP